MSEEFRRMRWRRHNNSLGSPPSMKNHTSTLFRNELIVFGGFDGSTNNNRVHVMNVDTGEWRVIDHVEGACPAGRNGHTATLANGKIFYIGGWLGAGPLGAADVHTLDPLTWTWSRAATSGSGPGPCNMHTADYVELGPNEKYILLFRGGDGQSYLNDLHLLDVDKMIWKHPLTRGRPPAPRANHSSAVLGKRLFIFGGWDGQSRLHDLHILDAVDMSWTCPETRGIPPTPRAGSTLTCIGDGLILFGGSGPHSSCFNDVHFFEPRTLTWYKAEKETFTQRNQVGGAKRSRVLENGRVEDDNPNVHHQTLPNVCKLLVQGEAPEKRAGHTATLVGNRRLLIVGGSFQTDYLKTVYELDTDPMPDLVLTTPTPSAALLKGVEQYFNSEEFADVVFIVENEKIFCHRIILSSQSEWFRVLFSRGFKESTTKEIPLSNVSMKVFRQVIEFIYMGSIPLLNGVKEEHQHLRTEVLGEDFVENSQDSEMPHAHRRLLAEVEQQQQPQQSTAVAATTSLEEDTISAVCELLIVADQFMCEHLRERCEIVLARMVNVKTVRSFSNFARANRALLLLRCCEHFEKWGNIS